MSDTPTPQKNTSGLAIAGLVLGIIAAITSFLPIINNLSFVLALIGLLLAVIALVGALKGKNTSKGMAIAGVVLCVISVIIVLVTQTIYGAALESVSESLSSSSSPQSATEEGGDTAAEEAPAEEEKAEETPAEEAPVEEEPAEEAASEPEQDFMHLAVGQAVNYEDGLTVCVNDFERGLADYSGDPVTRINVTYVNNGEKDQSFGTYDWDGEDASGVQRNSAIFGDGVDKLGSGTLSPGGTITGNLYLEGDVVRVIYTENMFLDDSKSAWVL